MNAKRISTSLLIITVITVLVVFAFHVRVAATADSVAVLKTTGMTCDSCSRRIIEALESVKGVSTTEVDVDGGWVIVSYDTKIVKPDSLAEKVSGAGYKSTVQEVLTPKEFQQITGRNPSQNAAISKGCCGGGNGGCGMKQTQEKGDEHDGTKE